MSLCVNPTCPKPQNLDNLLFCQSCGSQLLLQERYRVIKLLGEGGFAKTYQVSDRGTAKVLKLLLLDRPKAVSLFQQEARVLQQLNHRGIPKVDADGYFTIYPRNSQQPLHCLVMEYIEGQNLEEWMSQRGDANGEAKRLRPIPERLAVNWLKQLAAILARVHQQQYFHRDIKPANIMLRPNGQLALIDFGSAREINFTIIGERQKGTQIISAGYTPIEQANGQAVPQSDFFALGRTFVYLLTGQFPHDLPIAPRTGDLIWRNRANVSLEIADLIDDLMALFPIHRPQNAPAILQRLAEIETRLSQNNLSAPICQSMATESFQLSHYHRRAGFWWRLAAFGIDAAIATILVAVMGAFIINVVYDITESTWQAIAVFLGAVALGTIGGFLGLLIAISAGVDLIFVAIVFLGIIVKWLYFTLLESSSQKGTLGKMYLGIVVTDVRGDRLSWARANGRYWGKTVSGLFFMLGFVMAGFNPSKQALHDILAGTIVLKW